MSVPVLYSFRRCPYAMRGRMAIFMAGLRVELREVLLKDKPPDMIAASAKGTVPVLVELDGQVIDESLDVMRWALTQHDPERWLGQVDDPAIAVNDGPFKVHLDRYKYATRYDDASPEEDRTAGAEILAKLDARLQKGGWLRGEQRGFADIAIFPFVRQFRIADEAWFDAQNWPALKEWLTRCVTSDLFTGVMSKYDRWQSGDAPVYFGGDAKA